MLSHTRRSTRAQAPRGTPHPFRTWHRQGAHLLRRAPDPQLAVTVVAPAHDLATRHDGARVGIPRGDGGGGEAWEVSFVCSRSIVGLF
jgi:hypothetical protein